MTDPRVAFMRRNPTRAERLLRKQLRKKRVSERNHEGVVHPIETELP